ncbi:MAG: S-layer homology domain-containing protein, partial [Firmicutes bacterium]|nr:S-layer homology domain-containing protein [Bacillota bacterium]
MKSKFRRVALLSALIITLILAGTAYAGGSDFKDAGTLNSPDYSWAVSDIALATDVGLIRGYPDGTFQPGNTITRAEFSAMMQRALDKWEGQVSPFGDVPRDAWFTMYVDVLVASGVIKQSDYGSTLKPDEPITRKEIASWTARAAGLYGADAGDGELKFSDYTGD